MILVVGGAGYIGSHMVKQLARLDEPCVVFDNLEKGHRQALNGAPLFRGDLRNREDLRQVFEKYPIDAVMHFAALISVPHSVAEPHVYWENNLIGVKNLLDAMRDAKVKSVVFSSTAAIYGEPKYNPVDELHPKNPTNAYGATKLAAEHLISNYDLGFGIKNVCLRYFNAAGADPEGELGSDHMPEEALIPVAILSAMGQRPAMKVFGTDYPTPDGTAVRDYIHVSDLISAHVLALNHLRSGGDSRAYNLGNERGFSVLEVIKALSKASGKELPIEYASRRPGDAGEVIASSAQIKKDWGWTPKYPELSTMIEHAWAWKSKHPNGYSD